jgi:hypothetical protein
MLNSITGNGEGAVISLIIPNAAGIARSGCMEMGVGADTVTA